MTKKDTLLEKLHNHFYFEDYEVDVVSETSNMVVLSEKNIPFNYCVKVDEDNLYGFSLSRNPDDNFLDLEDIGFLYNGFAEILIQNVEEEVELFIENKLNISVHKPSLLFEIVKTEIICDDMYVRELTHTISLYGYGELENIEELNKYVSKSLFLLGLEKNSYEFQDYPFITEYIGEDYFYDNNDVDNMLKQEGKRIKALVQNVPDMPFEPIAYYNSGVQETNNDVSFHYFYKSIEYYFDSRLKGEKKQLQKVLQNCEDHLGNAIEFGVAAGIIKQRNITNLNSIIYNRRCRIVHSKKNADKKPPYFLSTNLKIDKNWSILIQMISLVVIGCYSNKK